MKKSLFYLFGGLVSLSALSCSVEENDFTPLPSDPRVSMEFTASGADVRNQAASKTVIDSENNYVYWSEDDAISIFDASASNARFVITSGWGSATATFEGAAVPSGTYHALYPYSAAASISGTTISSVLPTEQFSTADATFDTGLNPSVAVTGGQTLTFRNIAGLIRLTLGNLDGKAVSEIHLKADQSMTGAYTVDASRTDPAATAVSGSEETVGVRLSAADGGALAEGPYYLVVLPGDYTGMKVNVIFTDGSHISASAGNVSVTAGHCKPVTVDASKAAANDEGLYGLFMSGQDIYIGGKAYNKSQFDEDRIKYRTGEFSISSSNNGQILFLDETAVVTSFSAAADLIVIGNNPENKNLITIDARKFLTPVAGQKSRLVASNLIFDASAVTTYFFAVNKDYEEEGSFNEVVFDNCEIRNGSNAFLTLAANTNNYIPRVDRFVLQDCNFSLPSGSSNRFVFHTGGITTEVREMIIRNNVFYVADGGSVQSFRLLSGTPNNTNGTTAGSLIVENNTFVNIIYDGNSLIIAKDYGELEYSGNLLYFQGTYTGTPPANIFTVRAFKDGGGYPSSPACFGNAVYHNLTASNIYMFYPENYTATGGVYAQPEILDSDPFEGGDMSAFRPAPEFADYGAKR